MPVYEFRSVDGAVYEEYHSMHDAPPFGSTRIVEGVEFTRFPEGAGMTVENYAHVSVRWPKKHLWRDSTGKGHPARKFAANGDMICETRADVLDFKAKCAERGIDVGWNG